MNIHKNARLTLVRRAELGRRASQPRADISALLAVHGFRNVWPSMSRFDDWYVRDDLRWRPFTARRYAARRRLEAGRSGAYMG